MKKDEKEAYDQTEKELKHLIEKAQNENSALTKILKKLSGQNDQKQSFVTQNGEKKKTSKKINN